MNNARFETLAEAFGGDVARWPAQEREDAAELMLATPDWAARVLANAAVLDAQLMSHAAPRATPGLTARIVAGAPLPRRARWMAWLLPAGIGAGLVATSLAGFAIGLQLPARTSPMVEAASIVTVLVDDDFGFEADEEV